MHICPMASGAGRSFLASQNGKALAALWEHQRILQSVSGPLGALQELEL